MIDFIFFDAFSRKHATGIYVVDGVSLLLNLTLSVFFVAFLLNFFLLTFFLFKGPSETTNISPEWS